MSPPDTTQDQVFHFLADPATHGGAAVHRIDTHAASVFLAGDRAFKVKRAVMFPFLDYTTLALRKAACEAEITVNAPFAPQIYRRVVPITREADGRLVLGGQGPPVEYVLEMQRFDETQTLDRLADAGRIDAALAEALGRAIAAAHARLPAIEATPWIKSLATIIDQNDREFRQSPDLFDPQAVAALHRASATALAAIGPLLAARGATGLVRRGHGDLHLGNIVLINGAPVLFDAIEFDPLIASGDVFYDLAFLLMDLVERGLRDAANIVFNRYLRETRRDEDFAGLAALPLFLSLRAAIRAKVAAARRARDGGMVAKTTARDYFALASRLLDRPPPRMVAIGGLSGTGKSLAAAALAPLLLPEPGAVVVRTDVERKAMFGIAETERLPPSAYSAAATMSVYAIAANAAQRVLAAGHSVIVDAVFASANERAAAADVARTAGAPFCGLFLTATLEARLRRVGARTADASDADATVARQQEHYDLGALDWIAVDANGTPADTLRNIRSALGRR